MVRGRAPVDLETVDSLEPGSVRKSGLGWKAEPIKKSDVFSLDEDSIKTIEFENSRKEYGALKDYLSRGGGNSRMDSNVTKFRALDDLKVWNKDKSKTWDEGLGDKGGNRSFSEVYQWIKRKGKKIPDRYGKLMKKNFPQPLILIVLVALFCFLIGQVGSILGEGFSMLDFLPKWMGN